MRIAVTGTEGQVSRALLERGQQSGADIVAVGRPHLDLLESESILPALRAAEADAVVNAAAYTAVDRAESEPDIAEAVNGHGAGLVAAAAARLGLPIVHLSTDYVFAGDLDRPYREDDATGPLGVYGRTKLSGERAVAAATPNHVILRTSWVYSPFGTNFVKTMLRLAESRDIIAVVADQHGAPTSALDIADAVVRVCRNMLLHPQRDDLRGLFHMAGGGTTTWAGFAEALFAASRGHGGPYSAVEAIPSSAYPTAARRPMNSRLDCGKLRDRHGVALPDWRMASRDCVIRLVSEGART